MNHQEHLCWIHIKNVPFFLKLGANEHERHIGQNCKLSLSLQIPYTNTHDKLEQTLDYGKVIEFVQNFFAQLPEVQLLEYLVETLLDALGKNFPQLHAAHITITKNYIPLPHFAGEVSIEAKRTYKNLT